MKIVKIILLIFCFSFASCTVNDKRTSSFTFIDLTQSNGWNEVASVHLDNNRTVRIQLLHHGHTKTFFHDTVDNATFNKIDSLAALAFRTKYDSVIGAPVPDGGGSNIILKSKMEEIRTMIWRPASSSADLDSLIMTVVSLKNKFRRPTTDTSFTFLSYWRLAPIPPLDTTAIFVSPIVKPDQVDTSASR